MVGRRLGGQHRSYAVDSVAKTEEESEVSIADRRGECMRYSLGAHVRQTTPDILYGDVGQLWVDRSDDFLVWLFELWTSKSPREGFGGHLVL